MKKSTQEIIEALGWILTMLILPILGLIFWIFRMRNLKKKNPEMTRGYMWWAFGAAGAVWFLILFPIVFFIALVIANPEDFTSSLNKTEETSQYGSAEGLYKLTGVEFPEITMIDACLYVDAGLPQNYWYEHKFAVSPGDARSLHRRLERACVTDSTHWGILDTPSYMRCEVLGHMGRNAHEEYAANPSKIYWYFIYPDSTSVDRSRGMCDRMVEKDDGSLTMDWDGSFVSVEVQNDTIWIREGWLR